MGASREVPPNVHNYLIGNNMSALRRPGGCGRKAQHHDLQPEPRRSQDCGEEHHTIAQEVQDSGNPIATIYSDYGQR